MDFGGFINLALSGFSFIHSWTKFITSVMVS